MEMKTIDLGWPCG